MPPTQETLALRVIKEVERLARKGNPSALFPFSEYLTDGGDLEPFRDWLVQATDESEHPVKLTARYIKRGRPRKDTRNDELVSDYNMLVGRVVSSQSMGDVARLLAIPPPIPRRDRKTEYDSFWSDVVSKGTHIYYVLPTTPRLELKQRDKLTPKQVCTILATRDHLAVETVEKIVASVQRERRRPGCSP